MGKKISLEQWFSDLRAQQMSADQKQAVYSRINDQINRTLFLNKVRWYMKVGSLTTAILFAVLLFFSAYSPSSPDELLVVETNNPAVKTLKLNGSTKLVSASSVGKLITVQWDISIFKDDELIETENLDSGDIVQLKEWARVVLTVREGVRATVVGPAEFTIERVTVNPTKDIYMLNLLEGEYIELKALPAKEKTTTNASQKQETVVVKTQTVEIQQLPATRNLDVTISTQDGRPVVENDGDDIIVKRLNQTDDGDLTVLARNETFVVEQDELTQEDVDLYAQELEDDTFAIRYEVDASTASSLQDDEEETSQEGSDNQLSSQDPDADNTTTPTRRVLDEATLTALERSLSAAYTQNHVNNIVLYTVTANSSAQQIAVNNLAANINAARKTAQLAPVAATIPVLIAGVQELQTTLQASYYVSPGLARSMYTLTTSLQQLSTLPVREDLTGSTFEEVVWVLAEEYGITVRG